MGHVTADIDFGLLFLPDCIQRAKTQKLISSASLNIPNNPNLKKIRLIVKYLLKTLVLSW